MGNSKIEALISRCQSCSSTLYRNGLYLEALQSAKAAVHMAPDSSTAHSNLGIVLMKHGHNDEAVNCFNKAIQIDRDQRMAATGRSLCFVRLRKSGLALKTIEAALKDSDGNDSYVYMDRARYRASKRDHRKVISDCSRCLESVSRPFGADYAFRADQHFAVGNYSDAADNYRRALQHWEFRDKGALFIMRARSLAALGQHERALFDARKAVTIRPNNQYAQLIIELISRSLKKGASGWGRNRKNVFFSIE